jgi:hypothetical protein
MIQNLAEKATTDHRDLTSACGSAAVAGIVLRYVTSVAKPGGLEVLLALIAVCALVGAYLFVARSKADGAVKAATVVGAAVVGGIGFALVSLVV